jgi:CBS domain-containing protein
MTMEEIARFLQQHPPFDVLPFAVLLRTAASMQIEYFPAQQVILAHNGQPAQFLYLICRGSVDLLREQDGQETLFDTLGPGEAFGHPSLIRAQPPLVTVRSRVETLAYLLPAAQFHQLRAEWPAFAQFFAASTIERLGYAVQHRHAEADPALFQTHLGALLHRPIVAISPEATVREAARRMSDERVSCLLVDNPPYGILDANSGILTDRDLRSRVLAAGLPDSTPVREVMTAPALSLPAESLVFEGLMLMLERGIHHLPITRDGLVVGMVTHTDILRQQQRSPAFLPGLLHRAQTVGELRNYTDQVAQTVDTLLDAGARVSDIGRVVAVAHDALLVRLLRDAERMLGAPPCPYAWLVVGSEGRYEQTLRTDQDNALIYADDAVPEAEGYFAALAQQVVEWLVACGFPPCPGNIMATNPEWRRPLSTWASYFSHWIAQPSEEALLRTAIFFDFRQVYGELDATTPLRAIIEKGRQNQVFLGRLARASLRQLAPLSFFGQVALERHGDQQNLLDLKHRGVAMVVDLARLFALEAGSSELNTISRLRKAAGASNLTTADSENLIAAFELISQIRLRHQQAQLSRDEAPTNMIVFPQLSARERRELKESLQAIAAVQRSVAFVYQTERIA